MITFSCPTCQKAFAVKDHYAGRSATCKSCHTPLVVPATSVPLAAPATPSLPPVRTRRLLADARQIAEEFSHSPVIHVRATAGTPPESYEVTYHLRGLEGPPDSPRPRDTHRVEIRLTSLYPRVPPHCRMLTPVFHPNIDDSVICIGDHWAASERLVDLVVRIGEMLAYQAYNIKSPLNARAAMWADLHPDELPTDARELRPPARSLP